MKIRRVSLLKTGQVKDLGTESDGSVCYLAILSSMSSVSSSGLVLVVQSVSHLLSAQVSLQLAPLEIWFLQISPWTLVESQCLQRH